MASVLLWRRQLTVRVSYMPRKFWTSELLLWSPGRFCFVGLGRLMLRIEIELCNFYNNIYSFYLLTEVQIVSKLCIHIILIDGRSGDGIPVGVRFSATVQIGLGTHPASFAMSVGVPQGKSRQGVAFTIHPIFRRQYTYTPTPLLGPYGRLQGKF